MSQVKKPVSITGLWLRRSGDKAEVLVEIDGLWRSVISEEIDGPFSHIAEPTGISMSPVDELTCESAPTPKPSVPEVRRCPKCGGTNFVTRPVDPCNLRKGLITFCVTDQTKCRWQERVA